MATIPGERTTGTPVVETVDTKFQYPGIPTTCDGAESVVWVETRISQGSGAFPITSSTTMGGGFNADSDDWRYTMIMPNGSVFGTTNGKGSDKVAFCIGCHQSVTPDQDNVMLLPEEYRVK